MEQELPLLESKEVHPLPHMVLLLVKPHMHRDLLLELHLMPLEIPQQFLSKLSAKALPLLLLLIRFWPLK
jgi:hypothetical protein